MNIRNAILKAADRLEANPGLFDFMNVKTISSPHDQGCYLAHIIQVASEIRGNVFIEYCCSSLLGVGAETFFDRMSEIGHNRKPLLDWANHASDGVQCLRLYADKYHPAESRALIPASVTRIFQMSHAELAAELA